MQNNIFEKANRFFNGIKESPEGVTELNRYDRKIEFEIFDGDSFSVVVKKGEVSLSKGVSDKPQPTVIRFISDQDLLIRIFNGRIRVTDAYTFWTEGEPQKGHLYLVEAPDKSVGGDDLGPLGRWAARLIRIGQEMR